MGFVRRGCARQGGGGTNSTTFSFSEKAFKVAAAAAAEEYKYHGTDAERASDHEGDRLVCQFAL